MRSTAEQEEAKRKEREQKRLAYLKLRNAIFAKVRRAGRRGCNASSGRTGRESGRDGVTGRMGARTRSSPHSRPVALQIDAGDRDESALELTGAVLKGNPDFATLFNFRRTTLQALFQE